MNQSVFNQWFVCIISLFLFGGCGLVQPNDESKVIFDDVMSSGSGQGTGSQNENNGSDGNGGENGEGQTKVDSDNDGLTDDEEAELGTNPNLADTDGDTLIDGDEVNGHGTDPLKTDTDDDYYSDYDELFVLPDQYPELTIDPLNPDDDGDAFHPRANQEGWPAVADCNNLDPNVFPGAPDAFGDGKDSDCKPDIATWEHTFGKGYTVRAEIVVNGFEDYGLKVYADHDTSPAENHGECSILPDEPDATTGCKTNCVADDYDLQYDNGNLTGYTDDHACDSWYYVFQPTGYSVTRTSDFTFHIDAIGRQNNHTSPTWVSQEADLGD